MELLEKEAVNEPEKNKLACEELVVMDETWPCRPPKGAADQAEDATSHTATDWEGEVKLPPAHTFFWTGSQYSASICPLGPEEPRATKDAEEDA